VISYKEIPLEFQPQEGASMSSHRRIGQRTSVSITPASVAVVLALALLAPWQQARSDERSGQQVVKAVCAACHASGAEGAPKIGDQEAWAKRAALGLSSLTQHALEGIRKMPAHGGNPSLTDLEVSRAIAYMVNRSGGHWIEPASRAELLNERSGERVVQLQCAKCHQAGVDGAPKIGDHASWAPRLTKGLDVLVRTAIRGHGGMPARGGMADLTDAEIRNAIVYMFNPDSARTRAAAPQHASMHDPNRATVDGMEILLGVQSAESLRALSKGAPERSMHGGVPSGSGIYHVNVSLLDAATQAPISDALVEVRVEALGMGGETKKLEPMKIGPAVSYGNFFDMEIKGPYWVIVRVQKPGSSRWLEARFRH
jgi:cytochrome c5